MQFLLLSSLFQVLIDGADDVHFEAPLELIVFAVRACFDLGHSRGRPASLLGRARSIEGSLAAIQVCLCIHWWFLLRKDTLVQ